MSKRDKHPYTIDELSIPGKLVIRYVKYRFLHSWVFVAITSFWLLFYLVASCVAWQGVIKDMLGIFVFSFVLFVFSVGVWSVIVNMKNRSLEEKIVYPIVDKLLEAASQRSPNKYGVERRKLIEINDGDISKGGQDESIVVFFADGSVCEYPFRFETLERNDGVIVRSLSLTHYVCSNERKIAKASSWIPKISVKTKMNLASFTFLLVGAGLSYLLLSVITTYNLPFVLGGSMFFILMLVTLGNKLESCNGIKNNRKRMMLDVMSHLMFFIKLMSNMTMAFLSIITVVIAVAVTTALPVLVVLRFMDWMLGIPISHATECFVTLVVSSFVIVYHPSYIRSVIDKIPFVFYTEGKKSKKRMADLMRYSYDASLVEFLLNLAYSSLITIICIKKYQNMGNLINAEIDDAILNALIVFLSFEGVRSSCKRIQLSSYHFFRKLILLLGT